MGKPPRRWRDQIEVAIIINQLATPGLGSWMVGRRIAGAGQLALSCTGFGFFVVFFFQVLRTAWLAAGGESQVPSPDPFWWKYALILFGAAWVWSGITSVQLLIVRQRQRRDAPPRLP